MDLAKNLATLERNSSQWPAGGRISLAEALRLQDQRIKWPESGREVAREWPEVAGQWLRVADFGARGRRVRVRFSGSSPQQPFPTEWPLSINTSPPQVGAGTLLSCISSSFALQV